jgi:hypothetical protein
VALQNITRLRVRTHCRESVEVGEDIADPRTAEVLRQLRVATFVFVGEVLEAGPIEHEVAPGRFQVAVAIQLPVGAADGMTCATILRLSPRGF